MFNGDCARMVLSIGITAACCAAAIAAETPHVSVYAQIYPYTRAETAA
jgi:hypothetical protein